jgi:hypothetical protein
MDCEWESLPEGIYICSACGVTRKEPLKRWCQSTPQKAWRCEYLTDEIEKTVKLFGVGCPSSRVNGIEVSALWCENPENKSGLCVPHPYGTHTSDPSLWMCHTCPFNPRNRDISPT